MMRVAAALGRSARMSPAESADVVIEMDAVNGELGPDFAALDCPTVFVVGTGAHSGATEDEMRTVRAAAADAKERNERVSVFRDDAPQAHADPQQGPRHRGRGDRGRRPRVLLSSVQSGYSSLRHARGSSGCGFGVRSSSMPKWG